MVEGIKIVTMFQCVRSLVPEGWTNIRQSILDILFLENYSMWQHQRLHSDN